MAQTGQPTIQAPPERAMLTATDVAALLGCDRNQVAKMREQGKLPCIQWGDRTYRYPRAAVEAYLRGERTDAGAAEAPVPALETADLIRLIDQRLDERLAAALRGALAALEQPTR